MGGKGIRRQVGQNVASTASTREYLVGERTPRNRKSHLGRPGGRLTVEWAVGRSSKSDRWASGSLLEGTPRERGWGLRRPLTKTSYRVCGHIMHGGSAHQPTGIS